MQLDKKGLVLEARGQGMATGTGAEVGAFPAMLQGHGQPGLVREGHRADAAWSCRSAGVWSCGARVSADSVAPGFLSLT